MLLLNYFLISLISYLGIVVGCILLFIAPEEKKPGAIYFRYISYAIYLIIICSILLLHFDIIWLFITLISIAVFIFFELKIKKVYFLGYYFAYAIFSFYFFKFYGVKSWDIFLSVAIFAFGLCFGAIISDPKKKQQSIIWASSFCYFVIFAILLKLILG